ncbi:MAG: 5'-3'-deoxyribonucleotidase, partial [Nanoarchaeota archaeon]|nr:5'-3'-deoxyribonucleotidase [Nanoarchaeota archaeon]
MSETIHSKRILIDQDNVLANFDKGFLTAWQQYYPERIFVPLDKRQKFHIRDDYPMEFKEDVENIYSSPG